MSDIDELLQEDISIIDDIEEPETPEAPEEAPKEPTEPEAEPKVEGEEQEPVEVVEQPQEPVEPKPLTEDNLRSIISELRQEEHDSTKQFDDVYKDIQSRYYPDGISRVLTDTVTGREIRTAQDVIELSGNPDLTIEEAERWRLVAQAKLDSQVAEIEATTRNIAEQTIALDRGAQRVQEKYGELFKAYPALERKITAQYLKTVKIDKDTSAILSAPNDIVEYYDFALEPYQLAFEASKSGNGGGTTPPVAPPVIPPIATPPNKDDRLDEHGDGGASDDDDDPNDFEAQLRKEFNS